jgi:hypothetical protein
LPEGSDLNEVLGLASDDVQSLPLDLNMVPRFPIQVLERNTHYVVLTDEFGVMKRMLRSDYERSQGWKTNAGQMSAMSQWLDFPVRDLSTWKAIYEERFQPQIPDRLPREWESKKREFAARSQTRWVTFFCFPLVGLFGPVRELMGLEGLLYAMHDAPHLVHTIVDDLTDFWLATFAPVLADVRLDQITFFEDMCATKAPLISPAAFREFCAPGYRKVIGGLRDMGVQHFFVDTDGNANLLVPELLACGVTGLHPCEVQAHMDVEELRISYPSLCLNAGIDKRALVRGPEAIRAEVERCLTVAWRYGRYTPSLDHGAPPDISWSNIQAYAKLYRAWCASPPEDRRPRSALSSV